MVSLNIRNLTLNLWRVSSFWTVMHQTPLTSSHLIDHVILLFLIISLSSNLLTVVWLPLPGLPCVRGRERADLRTHMPCALVVWVVVVTAVS